MPRLPFALLLFALLFPTVGTLGYFVWADGGSNSTAFRVTYSVVKGLQFALPVLVLWWLARERLWKVRLSWRGWSVGVLFGVLTAALMLGVYFGAMRGGDVFAHVTNEVRAKVAGFSVTTPATYIALVIFIAIVHSFLEEYYWRWFVYGALRECCSQPWALLISALAFMAHHVVVLYVYFPNHWGSAVVPFSLGVAVGGAVWAWWYEKTGSLAGAWLAHIGADLGIMAVGYDLLYG